jgi:RecB family endonuclease NucS
VIELKVSRGSDAVAGQILKYMNWVKRNLADGGEVRGVIVAQHVSEKLQYSLADRTDVQLFEYEISMNLRAVRPLA